MRFVLRAGLLAVIALPAAQAASAQGYPVYDTGTDQLTQNTGSTVQPTKDTAAATKSIQNTLQSVPSMSNYFPGVGDTAANDSILNPMPSVSAVTSALNFQTLDTGQQNIQMGGGDCTIFTTSNYLYTQNPQPKPNTTDPVLDAQDGVLRVSSNIQGMALDNLTQLQARLQGINDLVTALNNAHDITTVAAINAKLSIAAVAVEAQQAQAANLTAIATAQSEINRENEAQAMRNEHVQTASLFSGFLKGLGGSVAGVVP